MKGNRTFMAGGRRSMVGAVLGALGLLAGGGAAGAVNIETRSPAPPAMVRRVGETEKRQRAWRRTRKQVLARALVWGGLGGSMRSLGRRFPLFRGKAISTGRKVASADGITKWTIYSDGSWRIPNRVNGKAARKIVRRMRHCTPSMRSYYASQLRALRS